MRKKNIHGGGAKTNTHGLKFERNTDIKEKLASLSYLTQAENQIDFYYNNEKIVCVLEKHGFYKNFIAPCGIDVKRVLSKKLLPDTAIINYINKHVYIIEKKYQEGAGSVDEKLQTCDYKLKTYKRLLATTEFAVELIYILNDWFKRDEYKDSFNYMESVGCKHYFNELPLSAICLTQENIVSHLRLA